DRPIKLTPSSPVPNQNLATDPLPPSDPNFGNMNILQALKHNRDVFKHSTVRRERAIALAWILHLVGDLHQPLHNAALFSNHFDGPSGDRGGNWILIGPAPGTGTHIAGIANPHPSDELLTAESAAASHSHASSSKPELHGFWDGAFSQDEHTNLDGLRT